MRGRRALGYRWRMRILDSALARPGALAAACCLVALPACAADGPSFDCARVGSQVNRMICASPELAALDRRLADHFRALQGQPGTDTAALQREEAAWLRDVRNPCVDAACVKRAYEARDAELLARSRRAASPAAADETQPFAVEPALWTAVQSLRGSRCEFGDKLLAGSGFGPVPGALPVVSNGSVVVERRRQGADFAFLVDTRGHGCRVVDVVALPPLAQAGRLLQCAVPPDAGAVDPLSTGVGLRRAGQKAPLAYWEVNLAAGQLIRQPLGVLGWTTTLRCQEPETGE